MVFLDYILQCLERYASHVIEPYRYNKWRKDTVPSDEDYIVQYDKDNGIIYLCSEMYDELIHYTLSIYIISHAKIHRLIDSTARKATHLYFFLSGCYEDYPAITSIVSYRIDDEIISFGWKGGCPGDVYIPSYIIYTIRGIYIHSWGCRDNRIIDAIMQSKTLVYFYHNIPLCDCTDCGDCRNFGVVMNRLCKNNESNASDSSEWEIGINTKVLSFVKKNSAQWMYYLTVLNGIDANVVLLIYEFYLSMYMPSHNLKVMCI